MTAAKPEIWRVPSVASVGSQVAGWLAAVEVDMRWPLWRVAVAERSMEPTLRPGDWLVVLRTTRVRPGQVVISRHPGRPGMLVVKRAAQRGPAGWWLISDSENGAAVDSRAFGAVPAQLIEGRVLLRYWPLRRR